MAKRYSGDLQISVVYDDRGDYRTSVSEGGKVLWRGRVNPARAGFGVGVAYDSPKAYDEIVRSAISFADHEKPGIGDSAAMNDSGYTVSRTRARSWGQRRAGVKRSSVRDPGLARRAGRAYGKTAKTVRSAKAKWTRAVADARVALANAKTSAARARAKATLAYANAKLRAAKAYGKAKETVGRTRRKSRAAMGAWSAQQDPGIRKKRRRAKRAKRAQ